MLSQRAALEVARFLNEPKNRDAFLERLGDWSIAAEALEAAGFLHHAQQLRALIAFASKFHEKFHESISVDTLSELRIEARDLLTGGPAPKSIWGDMRQIGDDLVLDSIYVHGYPSLRIEVRPSVRRLESGEQLRSFRTIYAGHRYSGKSRNLPNGYLQLHRGAAVRRGRS